jgi:hypothetical protein
MGVLESVLQYKAHREAQEAADIQAIPTALAAFTQARQAAQKSQLETLLAQSTILKNNADVLKSQNEASLLQTFLGGAGGNNGILIPEFTVGGAKMVNPQAQQQIQEQSEDVKNVSEARKNLDSYASNAYEAIGAIEKIEQKAAALGDFSRGPVEQAVAKGSMAVREFSEDKTVNEFKQAIAQEMSPLVRKLAEEKGPLTDRDIERAVEGVGGKLTRPLADKKTALADLRAKVKAAVLAKAQIAGMTEEQLKQKYPDLYNKIMSDGMTNNTTTDMSNLAELAKAELAKRSKKKGS